MTKARTAENVIEQINIENAKKIAMVIVVGFIAYHGMLHLRYGIDSCKWLMSDGRFKGNHEWQPFGCMMHHYTHTDTKRCLRYLDYWGQTNHFAFIGDSRMLQLYKSFVGHLQMKNDEFDFLPSHFHKNLTFTDTKMRVKVEYVNYDAPTAEFVANFKRWSKTPKTPTFIITGTGVWIVKETNVTQIKDTLATYATNLTRLIVPAKNITKKKARILWALQAPINAEKLSEYVGYEAITNEHINLFNRQAIDALSGSTLDIWWSMRLVADGMIRDSPDGMHLGKKARQHTTQILLNMYCNDHMNFNDGTCCSTREPNTIVQIITLSLLLVCVSIACAMLLYRWFQVLRGTAYTLLPTNATTNGSGSGNGQVSQPVRDYYLLFTSLAKLSLILFYFFICDRTNFFMKENKYYSEFSFWIPVGYVCALGLFFNDDSRYTTVLHADQMDEFQGWMQMIILIYSMIGASKILPIYMVIQSLISAYLFLAGFKHFTHAWTHGDFTLVKFFRVIFKLNFMTVLLCFCMNRPYQFYYFIPLLSFWYTMLYILLALPPQVHAHSAESNPLHYLYLVLKLVIFFSIVTILYMSEVFFEKVFVTRPWKALFVTVDDDIHEWWDRWKTDRYSIQYGVIFAILYCIAQKYQLLNDTNHSNLFPKRIALTATLLAIIATGAYVTFICLCRNQFECTEVHSYVNLIPILSYIVFHNISGLLRARYSTLFAWFGRIYLELFVSQYHIWLAADTHGVLVLLPNHPTLNVVITTFIFICAAHEIHRLTNVLLPYAVPADWKLVLRNFAVFLAILVPVGIKDGMF